MLWFPQLNSPITKKAHWEPQNYTQLKLQRSHSNITAQSNLTGTIHFKQGNSPSLFFWVICVNALQEIYTFVCILTPNAFYGICLHTGLQAGHANFLSAKH